MRVIAKIKVLTQSGKQIEEGSVWGVSSIDDGGSLVWLIANRNLGSEVMYVSTEVFNMAFSELKNN